MPIQEALQAHSSSATFLHDIPRPKPFFHTRIQCLKKYKIQSEINRHFQRNHIKIASRLTIDLDTVKTAIGETGITRLYHTLRELKSLPSLYLKAPAENNKPIRHFLMSLKYLAPPSTLRFSISGHKEITDDFIKNFSFALRSLSNVSSLTLAFKTRYFLASPEITDKGIRVLCSGLKGLVSLSAISLDFSHCKSITQQGIESLNLCLRHFILLSSLTVYYKETSSKSGLHLFTGLNHLKSLEALTMDFSGRANTTETDMRIISSGLENLRSLSSLHLDLSCCSNVTEESLIGLFEAIQQLSSLSSLSLKLWNNPQLAYKGIQSLSSCLSSLRSLSALKIDLKICQEITDEGIISLSESLKHIPELSHFALNLLNCSKITSKSIDGLFSALREVNLLSSVDLNMRWCENSTYTNNEELYQKLAKCPNLRSIALNSFPIMSYGNRTQCK